MVHGSANVLCSLCLLLLLTYFSLNSSDFKMRLEAVLRGVCSLWILKNCSERREQKKQTCRPGSRFLEYWFLNSSRLFVKMIWGKKIFMLFLTFWQQVPGIQQTKSILYLYICWFLFVLMFDCILLWVSWLSRTNLGCRTSEWFQVQYNLCTKQCNYLDLTHTSKIAQTNYQQIF